MNNEIILSFKGIKKISLEGRDYNDVKEELIGVAKEIQETYGIKFESDFIWITRNSSKGPSVSNAIKMERNEDESTKE